MVQIGVDIGGTNIKIGLVDDSLEIVARTSIRFPHESAPEVAAAYAAAIRRVLAEAGVAESELDSIGVVVPAASTPPARRSSTRTTSASTTCPSKS